MSQPTMPEWATQRGDELQKKVERLKKEASALDPKDLGNLKRLTALTCQMHEVAGELRGIHGALEHMKYDLENGVLSEGPGRKRARWGW